MQKYISNLKHIGKQDQPSSINSSILNSLTHPHTDTDENPLQKSQDVRQSFFMKAFEIYLEKTLAKNIQNKQKNTAKNNSYFNDNEDNPNLPENVRNIRKLIKSHKNRNKLKGTTKTDKFEKKMEIFKGLNSFIDIKSFLLQSNVTNYNNSEEMVMKFKSQYKDSLHNVLTEEQKPQTNRNHHIFSFNATQQKENEIASAKEKNVQQLEENMLKFKKIIDVSKEKVTRFHFVRKTQEPKETEEAISTVLYSHLSENFKIPNKTATRETNEELNQDIIFNDSLENLENRFIYNQKYLAPMKKKGSGESISPDQKKRHHDEVDKLDQVIKKIILQGVMGKDGEPATNEFYLNEFKNQYKRITKVLHKVTKNIFKKDLDRKKLSLLSKNKMNSNSQLNTTPNYDLKSPFITDFSIKETKETENNPYFLNRRDSGIIIKRNILEAGKLKSNSLQSHRNSTKPMSIKEIASTNEIEKQKMKLKLPKIIAHIQEKHSSFDPYFQNGDDSMTQSKRSLSSRSYKRENRVIHKRFDKFLKSIDRVETMQKFMTEDLIGNMGEMSKELKKLNYEKEGVQSIREVDPNGFKNHRNLYGNDFKKTMKRMTKL